MAETPPSGLQNKRLLLAAAAVGVVFLVLLNMQRVLEKRQFHRNRVQFVLVKVDLSPGQVLTDSVVEPIALPREVAEKAMGLYPFNRVELGETQVQRFVAKNELLHLTDMQERLATEDTLSKRVRGDRQVISLAVDSRSPSAFVRSGSRVDVLGAIQIAGKPTRTQLIIENLEVLSVDGEVNPAKQRNNYHSVEVHVPTELVANLKEVQRRIVGALTISVRRPGDQDMRYPYDRNRLDMGGTIAPEVLSSLAKSFVSPRRSAPSESGAFGR